MGSCTSKKKPKDEIRKKSVPNSSPKSSSNPEPNPKLANFPTFYYLEKSKGSLYLISKSTLLEYPIKTPFRLPQESAMAFLSIESILLVGGVQSNSLCKSVLSISLSSKKLNEHDSLPIACKQGQLHECNQNVYFIGGLTTGVKGLEQAPLMKFSIKTGKWEVLYLAGEDQKFNKIVNMGTCILGNKLLLVGGQRIASDGQLKNSKRIYSVGVDEGFKVKFEGKLPVKVTRANIAAGEKSAVVSGGVRAKSNKPNRASFIINLEGDAYFVSRIKDVGIDLTEKYPATYTQEFAFFLSFPFVAVKRLQGWVGFKITGKETRDVLEFDDLPDNRSEEVSSDDSLDLGDYKKIIKGEGEKNEEKMMSLFVKKIDEGVGKNNEMKAKENNGQKKIEENKEVKRKNENIDHREKAQMANKIITASSFSSDDSESESSSLDSSSSHKTSEKIPGIQLNTNLPGKTDNQPGAIKKIAADMPGLVSVSESSSPNFSKASQILNADKQPQSIPILPSPLSIPLIPSVTNFPPFSDPPKQSAPILPSFLGPSTHSFLNLPASQTTNITNTLSISSSSSSKSFKFTGSDNKTIELYTMSSKQSPVLEVDEKVNTKHFQFECNQVEEFEGVVDLDLKAEELGVRVLIPENQDVKFSSVNTQSKFPEIPKLKIENQDPITNPETFLARPKTVELRRDSKKALKLRRIQPYITTRTFGTNIHLLATIDKRRMTFTNPRTDRPSHDFGEQYAKTLSNRPSLNILKNLSPKKLFPSTKIKIKRKIFFNPENIQKLLDIISNEFKKPRILSPNINSTDTLLIFLQSILPSTYSLSNLNNILIGIPLIFSKSDFSSNQLTFILSRSNLNSDCPSPASFTQAIYKAYKVALLKSH